MNHDVSCRAVIPILKYVGSRGFNVDLLTSGLVEKHYIENPKTTCLDHWSQTSQRFHCHHLVDDCHWGDRSFRLEYSVANLVRDSTRFYHCIQSLTTLATWGGVPQVYQETTHGAWVAKVVRLWMQW